MRRRDLLRGGAAALLGGPAIMSTRRTIAQNQPAVQRFGQLPPAGSADDPWRQRFEGDRPVFKVLEIFLYGGLSPWETFYVNPAMGGEMNACDANLGTCEQGTAGLVAAPDPAAKQWGTYRCQFESLARADQQAGRRPALPMTREFFDGIHLGPATYPLWRDDIFNSMQVLVMSHDLLPHEAAIPYCLTGARLGRPNMLGTGTAINKNRAGDPLPAAYVVNTQGDFTSDNVLSATSSGLLESAYRPLALEVPEGGPNFASLTRTEVSGEDALLQYYLDQYKSRLEWVPPGESAASRVRSAAFNDYDAAVGQFLQRSQIRSALTGYSPTGTTPQYIDQPEPANTCIIANAPRTATVQADRTRQSLNFAAYLLNNTFTSYVCVVDTGREAASGGGGYDTHFGTAVTTYRNLTNTLEIIAEMTDPNQAGGPRIDPFTLIVITTEFGRTPEPQGGDGRDHYPYAYVNVLIPPPNPVKPRPARRIVGGIDEDARVVKRAGSDLAAVTPTDLRGALLLALGVDPFADGLFGVGDFSEGIAQGNEETARTNLVRKVLGYAI